LTVTPDCSPWKPARHTPCAASCADEPPPFSVPLRLSVPEPEPEPVLSSLPLSLAAPQPDIASAKMAMPGTIARRMDLVFTRIS
jgi:hypothetical protein